MSLSIHKQGRAETLDATLAEGESDLLGTSISDSQTIGGLAWLLRGHQTRGAVWRWLPRLLPCPPLPPSHTSALGNK